MLRQEDVRLCRTIMRKHGVSYAFATRWFPRRIRDATTVLYAFFRLPDDMVDRAEQGGDPRAALEAWIAAWTSAQQGGSIDHPVLRAAHAVFVTHHIPFALGDDFLAAMVQDLTVTRYATYAELEQYMYGSAAVVGIMMSYVIGFKDEGTLAKAKALGEAMQLTNFLRDIREDYDDRGRVYLPQEDLVRFGVHEEDIREHRLTPEVIALLKYEIDRARALYAAAEPGINELALEGRLAVRLASRLYAEILTKIEAAAYDVFHVRARTSWVEKMKIGFEVWKTQKNTQ